MSRRSEIQNAYKYLGKEATFYDGMITCSTLPGKAVCKLVWNMDWETNTRYLERALSGIPQDAAGSRVCVLDIRAGLTLEVQHDINQVFKDFRAGQSAIFCDVSDNYHGSIAGFSGANNQVAAIADLADGAGRGANFGQRQGLNGIDND